MDTIRNLMDAGLTETQCRVRAEVRHLAEATIAPVIEQYEKEGRYPRELLPAIAERGFFGAFVPPEYGGRALDYVSYAIIVEELARVDRVCASLVHVQNSLLCACLMRFGDEELKRAYLPKLASGQWFSAACFTETDIGSDLAGVETRAMKDGNAYRLSGTKMYISHAEVANLFFVLASTDPALRQKGTVALLVERDLAGITIERIPMRTMRRGSICKVIFDEVKVPVSRRLLGEGDGLKVGSANLDVGRFSVAAQALGQAQAAVDSAIDWARSRNQFGQPIGQFQMIQQKIADMLMSVEAARMLVYRVGMLKNQDVPRVSIHAAMAKCYASEVAGKVAMEAIQILGARGLSEECAVSRIPLEAKVLEIAEGSNQIQRKLIAEFALGFRKH